MFKGTKVFLAAALSAVTMMPASAGINNRLSLHPELQEAMTQKAKMGDKANLRAKQSMPLIMKHQVKQLAKPSPFASAQKNFAFRGASTQVMHRAPMAGAPTNIYAYANYGSWLNVGSMYNISMPSAEFSELAPITSGVNSSAVMADGLYRTIYADDSYAWLGFYFFDIISYNPETWEVVSDMEVDDGGYGWFNHCLTVAPDGANGFGLFYNTEATDFEFATVDFETGTKTVVGSATNFYLVMGTAPDGTVYGVADDNNLYKINTNTGAETLVGPTGLVVSDAEGSYGQSATIDPKTGVMYWAAVETSMNCGLYTVDTTTGAASLVSAFNGPTQIFGMAIPTPAAEEGAPAAVENVSAVFADGSNVGTVSFTAPTTTFAGAELTGELDYTVAAGEVSVSGKCDAGAEVTVEMELPTGMNTILVTVANEAGVSPKAKTMLYVGYDTPMAPANVVLAISEEGEVNLTWEAPVAGIHNGWLGALTYNVYRNNAGASELVAEGLAETAFAETLTVGALASYNYSVEAVNGELVSAKANSNGVSVGSAFEVPFTMNFANKDVFDLMTVINNNGDAKTWTWYESLGCARYSYNGSEAADDYLITPNIKLQAGRTYVLSTNAAAYSSYYPEKMEITIGQGSSVAAQTQVITPVHEVAYGDANVEEAEFSVAEDGIYNIAFHCLSDADQFHLQIFSFTLEAGPAAEAPAAVANLAVVPGEKGAKVATVSFVAPTAALNGEALQSLTKVTVARDGELIATLENVAPGQEVTYVDETVAAGTHTWTVVPFNEFDNGAKAEATAFVGEDVPAAPLGTLTDLGTQVRIDWEVSEVGVNGGYVNPENLTYELYSVDGGYIGELLASLSGVYTYTLDYDTNVGEADLLQFAMRSVGEGGTSNYMGTDAIVVGAPQALPWMEDFAGANITNFMWLSQDENQLDQITLSSYNGGAGLFVSSAEGQSGSLLTGKLTTAGAINPEVIFTTEGTADFDLEVVAQTIEGQEVIATYACGSATETHVAVIPAKFADAWVIIGFHAIAKGAGSLYIDNIMIRDVLEYNLSLELQAPASVAKGETAVVKAVVTNEGANNVESVTVKFTVGEASCEKTVNAVVAPFATAEVSLEVETSIFSEEEAIEVEAEVVYDLDLKPEDNAASATIELKTSTATPVEELAGVANEDGTVTLTWAATDVVVAEVTEDFESYENMTAFPVTAPDAQGNLPAEINEVGTLGDWTAYDLDGGGVYGWNSTAINWPYMGYAMGFAVYDANELWGTSIEEPLETVHSGTKGLICMDIAPENGITGNDDWLISPELPGVAQTISFWANEITDQYGHEVFEVFYSTTDMDVDSFILLGEGSSDAAAGWKQFSYDLPEGAKYFAIRVVSEDIFGLYLDDITFTKGTSAASSFLIYRDQECIGLTTENFFDDFDAQPGAHTYSVVAVYANGAKSAPVSVVVEVNPTGIDTINAESQLNAWTVNGVRVRANSADELQNGIYMINGKKVIK